MITIKPHHYIDMLKLYGAGLDRFVPDKEYGHDFYRIGNQIVDEPGTGLRFTLGCDDVCAPCRRKGEAGECRDSVANLPGYTSKEAYNRMLDQRLTETLCLEPDRIWRSRQFCALLYAREDIIYRVWTVEDPAATKRRNDLFRAGCERYLERPILETERLSLREMTQADFPALCKMLKDPEVMYAYEHAFEDEEARKWLDHQLERYRDDGFGLWAVVLKETGEMIGQCGLTMQDCGGRRMLEVGYLFQKAFWHRGYAIEAAAACKNYAFEVIGAEQVYSFIRDTNLASQRVALRNGMAVGETYIKQYYGVEMPHLVFSAKREK